MNINRPHAFEKGRGWGWILACEGTVAAFMKPTSLNRGEGLAAGSTGDIGGSESEGEGEEVVERSPKSTGETL